jgi:hypothetical protein
MTERLATSIGQTKRYSVTFEVSDIFLEENEPPTDWSDPVQFRFEKHEDGTYDLVFRRVEA